MPEWHWDVEQGSDAWLELRRGRITASDMHRLVTPAGKRRTGETPRQYALELAAQRVCGWVEPGAQSATLERGHRDEILARELYRERVADVKECGVVVSDAGIGYSPDGVIMRGGEAAGVIEVKSRVPRLHLEVVCEGQPDPDHVVQLQTALLVTGLPLVHYLSYCGGMPMAVISVRRDEELIAAIQEAAAACESHVRELVASYEHGLTQLVSFPTERIVEQEMFV